MHLMGEIIDRIKIRKHPSEAAEKYFWVENECSTPVEFGGEKSLIEEIHESTVVAGCESMALVVGLLANKRVISTIPPWGVQCHLPHGGIERLHGIIGTYNLK